MHTLKTTNLVERFMSIITKLNCVIVNGSIITKLVDISGEYTLQVLLGSRLKLYIITLESQGSQELSFYYFYFNIL